MSYADEQIIEALNSYKKKQYGDIETGIFIKEELYEFNRQEFFDGKMSVMLPNKFIDMPLELAKMKYPMEQRPQVIKMNEQSDINFTFSILEVELKSENVQELNEGFYHIIKKAQPANVFYEKKLEEMKDTVAGWFDFKSHGLDQKLYNLMYCIPIEGKLLHGIFNSPIQDAEAWKPIVLQVIHSIKDLTTIKGEKQHA